ncbi:hypothetical protein PFICI_06070 [Pestalotiopsis fici W106-1]|uniref:Aflatoxin biosynthesis ketoreductase nor-1 n=1 Tax=Pestalotiopsis fici (strain W106-1 / CGMCC3.15140) TaxID=1229662 RepID=W3X4K7_PESFW|nr:uncharacterized protein PFICI_06070 [Pestalotiopsis fici W106-1]ETS81068.1 hypothetical protein PFICI_06070 [Pestalotiopsis fici W106-1]
MSSQKIYLVTGANRGIGKGLVAAYISEPETVVIAAVRDPNHKTSQSLVLLPKATGSSLIIVKMDMQSSASISEAIDTLKTRHGIKNIDVVVSNAGIGEVTGRLVETPVSVIQRFIDVNTFGPLNLFKTCLPMLLESQSPKFCIISSLAGSNNSLNTMLPTAPYNASKLMVTHFARWFAVEVPEVTTWSVHPGLVDTDMGITGVDAITKMQPEIGASLKCISTEESVAGLKTVIEGATKENTSGHFLNYDGAELPW